MAILEYSSIRNAKASIWANFKKEAGIGMLLLVVCIVTTLKNPQFISADNLFNLGQRIGMYGIFAIGMGMVIITAGIDLSVGSLLALQGVLLAMMLRGSSLPPPLNLLAGHMPQWAWRFCWPWPWPIACLVCVALTVFVEFLHGVLITRLKLQPFIVTLCGFMIYRSIGQWISGDDAKGFGSKGFVFLRNLASGDLVGIPMPFIVLVVLAIAAAVLLHRSVWGRYLYAVGRNEEAARYSGINSRAIISSAYMINGLLLGIGGIIYAFNINTVTAANHAQSFELNAIAAAVLGGCSLWGGEGSILGIVIGTALLQVLQDLVNLLGIPSSLNFTVMGTVILVGVTADLLLSKRKRSKPVVVAVATPGETPNAPAVAGEQVTTRVP